MFCCLVMFCSDVIKKGKVLCFGIFLGYIIFCNRDYNLDYIVQEKYTWILRILKKCLRCRYEKCFENTIKLELLR